MTKALILGAYVGDQPTLTPAAESFNKQVGGKLQQLVVEHGPQKKGKSEVFYSLHKDYPVVCVVGLGPQDAGFNDVEDLDEKRENVRIAMAIGAKAVRDKNGVEELHFDPCGDGEAAAEGAHLCLFATDKYKSEKYKKKAVKVEPYSEAEAQAKAAFAKGTLLANAQNACRTFTDSPANLLTPTLFAGAVEDMFKGVPKTKVIVHDKHWAEDKKMGAFLSVAKGSIEPPKFVEIHYNNKPGTKPFVLVGKGICFDSGGISIKPSASMDEMRADMSGAANVITVAHALATSQAEVNIIVLTPMCENMPSGSATKPGDVVFAMNGKSIQIDNTDAEGRLILADALCYAHEFEPQAILDVATLTGAMMISLGFAASGAFTRSAKLWKGLQRAGAHSGDRVWRMPHYSYYSSLIVNSPLADLNNMAKLRYGGSASAAAFLSEFVTCPQWLHLDIASVMCVAGPMDDTPYYNTVMSGRPMRTLYHFLVDYFNKN